MTWTLNNMTSTQLDAFCTSAAKQAVASWRKRLGSQADLFSVAQQQAFLAQEVMSLVLGYADAERVNRAPAVDATCIAAIYKSAVAMILPEEVA